MISTGESEDMRAKVIKYITNFMALVLFASVMAVDSGTIIPIITGMISTIWILLVAIANSRTN